MIMIMKRADQKGQLRCACSTMWILIFLLPAAARAMRMHTTAFNALFEEKLQFNLTYTMTTGGEAVVV